MGFGQNDVIFSYFFEPKRRRFGSAIFFLKFRLYQNDVVLDKLLQNDVVLDQLSKNPKRRRFGLLTTASKRRRFAAVLFKTTSFWLLF